MKYRTLGEGADVRSKASIATAALPRKTALLRFKAYSALSGSKTFLSFFVDALPGNQRSLRSKKLWKNYSVLTKCAEFSQDESDHQPRL
jgi:hypothetical protein